MPLLLGAWGAARLLARSPRPCAPRSAAAVTAVAAVWLPATYERLLLGQWALLVSLAALPWVVLGALRLREQGRWVPLLPALVGAACGSPAGSVLAVAVGAVVAGWGRAADGAARGGGRGRAAAAVAAPVAAAARRVRQRPGRGARVRAR